jgi:hypothetical protein
MGKEERGNIEKRCVYREMYFYKGMMVEARGEEGRRNDLEILIIFRIKSCENTNGCM